MASPVPITALRDTSTFREDGSPGLTGRPIRGVRVVLEWCARALLTPPGSLPWAPGATSFDLAGLENADLTRTQLAQVRGLCDAAVRYGGKPYVVGVRSRVEFVPGSLAYRVGLVLQGAGVHPLMVHISEAGAALVSFA